MSMTAAVATDHPAATAGRMVVAAAAALRSAVHHGSLATVTSQDQSPTSFMISLVGHLIRAMVAIELTHTNVY